MKSNISTVRLTMTPSIITVRLMMKPSIITVKLMMKPKIITARLIITMRLMMKPKIIMEADDEAKYNNCEVMMNRAQYFTIKYEIKQILLNNKDSDMQRTRCPLQYLGQTK